MVGIDSRTSPILEAQRLGCSIRALANWILDYAEELRLPITNMALNKLAYFAYEKVLIERNEILTNAKIEAWEHGPVFREIYQSFKLYDNKPIDRRCEFFSVDSGKMEKPMANLSSDLEQYLRATLKPLLPLSAARLRDLSHVSGGAWHRVWCHEGQANPGMEISPAEIVEATRRKGVNS